LGFLDGLVGLEVCTLTGLSSFIKQVRLWELEHARVQPDPEVAQALSQDKADRHAA
jgi:hypothetical protein